MSKQYFNVFCAIEKRFIHWIFELIYYYSTYTYTNINRYTYTSNSIERSGCAIYFFAWNFAKPSRIVISSSNYNHKIIISDLSCFTNCINNAKLL